MIFGLVSGGANEYPEPCIVADKPSPFSIPIRIRTLLPTDYAVHLVSVEEGITVEFDQDNAIIISPIRPSRLYLTPNLPEKPGFSVNKLRLTPLGEQGYQVHFDRERGWEEWRPNVRIY